MIEAIAKNRCNCDSNEPVESYGRNIVNNMHTNKTMILSFTCINIVFFNSLYKRYTITIVQMKQRILENILVS